MTNRPRIHLGLETSSVQLNRHAASLIGQRLARARTGSALSLETIADRLLLSRNQVRALEDVAPDVFYNVRFHVAALRKYADLMGVEVKGTGRLLIEPEIGDEQTGGETSPAPLQRDGSHAGHALAGALARPRVSAAIGAGTLVTIVVLLLLIR